MADSPRNPDPLEPVLEDAEAELSKRLREACEAEERGISTESTEEIRRLEDALLSAAVAAKQTIAVRRHMAKRESAEPERPRSIETSPLADRKRPDSRLATDQPPIESIAKARETEAEMVASTVVREFTDSAGRAWRAWPVTPRVATSGPSGRRFLGSFQDGWICFEAMDSSSRRRLPRHQPRWAELQEDELERLLQQAIAAPVRAPKPS